MATNDGGPAFPQRFSITPDSFDPVAKRRLSTTEQNNYIFPGMSLRDYFAGQVMAFVLADKIGQESGGFDDVAADAYEMADAMLAARAKGGA